VQEIEEACVNSTPPSFDKYPNDVPDLTMEQTFYPLGFPLRIRTNSQEVLRQSEIKWGMFEKRFDIEPIVAEIHVIATDDTECPPLPHYSFFNNMMVVTAGTGNFCVAPFPNGKTRMVVTTAALRYPNYFRQVFLDCAAACQTASRLTTGVHAACVALKGRGVLLCGDSGAGKTSLSWACAQAGWDFVADDSVHLLNGSGSRMVIGNSHQVRFRPSAAELFPEIAGAEITPRLFGKPSIELPTAPMNNVNTRECVQADFIVFLNRRTPGAAELVPYRKDVARCFMRQWLFGTPESKTIQHAAIERLLAAPVLELRYECLHWAVDRLEKLVREGA
jgi:HPr Serine kinase C-terminal domain